MFKYSDQEVDAQELKKYCIKHFIHCEIQQQSVLLDIHFTNEEGLGWTEGEGMLPDLLPLYDEIKAKNYQFLHLVADINHKMSGETHPSANANKLELSPAQKAFFELANVDQEMIFE